MLNINICFKLNVFYLNSFKDVLCQNMFVSKNTNCQKNCFNFFGQGCHSILNLDLKFRHSASDLSGEKTESGEKANEIKRKTI